MFCSTHARVFLVALCLVFIAVVFESLLVGELSSHLTSRLLRRTSSSPIDLPNCDAPVKSNYTRVLLKAILDAPHSREWIVKGVLRWFMFCQWAFLGVTALNFHRQNPGLSTIGHNLWGVVARVSYGTSVAFSPSSGHVGVDTYGRAALRALVGSFVPRSSTLTPAPRIIPPRLLVTVSSAGLSPSRGPRFRGHARSPSQVAEITI
ncbi:hypothetical protein V8E55_008519 [Tylopilus felleus]